MKFRLSEFHFNIVSMTFSGSLYVSSGEMNKNRKIERRVQKVVCSSLVVHKYIDKRTMSRDET